MAKITIQFLGTGNAFSRKYGNTSALVSVENGDIVKRLLIDCGRTAPDDLSALGYTWADVDAIFITHLHGDHVYGLEDAGFQGRYVFQKRPMVIFPDQKLKNDLWEKVLKGTMMNEGNGSILKFEDYFEPVIINREDQYFFFNEVMFSVFSTQHIKNKKSYGVIIGERDYIIYTSDTLLNKDFLEIAASDGCQVIFHDCGFAHYANRVHASLQDLLTLEREVLDLIYIMHYGDDLGDHYLKIKENGMRIASRGTDYEFEVSSYKAGAMLE